MKTTVATCKEIREALLLWQRAWLYYSAPGPTTERAAHQMQEADRRLSSLILEEVAR